MSLNITDLTAYTDENKMDLIKKSILDARTLEYITIQADIKSSAAINILDSTLVGQVGSCGFNDAGETILSQRDLPVKAVKINESICLDTLEQFYIQKSMNAGSYNESIPFEQLYAEQKAEKIASMIDEIIWKGDTAGSGNIALADGLLKVIDAEATVVDGNTSGATSFTAANAVDVVDDMVEAIPEDVIAAEDQVLFMSYANYRTYSKALRDANLFAYTGAENQGGDFMQMVPGTNVKVVAVKGLNGTDRMVLTPSSNLYFGTDLLSDAEQFEIFYSKDNQEVRFVAKFKIGVQVAFPEFVVEYTNAV
tara:strand:- start:495 stop:1421 length:927 start_codon:yes stop_codon:yes gene_type:complete